MVSIVFSLSRCHHSHSSFRFGEHYKVTHKAFCVIREKVLDRGMDEDIHSIHCSFICFKQFTVTVKSSTMTSSPVTNPPMRLPGFDLLSSIRCANAETQRLAYCVRSLCVRLPSRVNTSSKSMKLY